MPAALGGAEVERVLHRVDGGADEGADGERELDEAGCYDAKAVVGLERLDDERLEEEEEDHPNRKYDMGALRSVCEMLELGWMLSYARSWGKGSVSLRMSISPEKINMKNLWSRHMVMLANDVCCFGKSRKSCIIPCAAGAKSKIGSVAC